MDICLFVFLTVYVLSSYEKGQMQKDSPALILHQAHRRLNMIQLVKSIRDSSCVWKECFIF